MALDAKQKDQFWMVVVGCLIRLFNFERTKAIETTLDLWERVDAAPRGVDSDLFYHAEPFDVARDLAQRPDAKLADYGERYEQIINIYRQHEYTGVRRNVRLEAFARLALQKI